MKISGKVAVVVGGARGIGRAYCEALLAKGAQVVMADVQCDLGEKTTCELVAAYGEGTAVFHHCDNTKDEDVKALFQKAVATFGTPEIFVHNAAIIHEYNWEKCLSVNVGGMVRCCTEALKHMSKASGGQGGVVVNTASISGLRPEVWGPVYAATKHANVGYTLSWGLPENVAVTGVRFNCICPTTVDTEFVKLVTPDRAYHADGKQDIIANSPKLTPEYVAEALIKLIEDDSLTSKALRVTTALGMDFAEFQDTPLQ